MLSYKLYNKSNNNNYIYYSYYIYMKKEKMTHTL